MIDSVKIYVKAGDGGPGCNSFTGKRFTRSWHPDGGDGGKGADVIIKVDRNAQNLAKFQFKHHFRAADGKQGRANKKKGAQGPPSIIKVPLGTIVRDIDNNLLLGDLTEENAELVVAKGGEGGRGNSKTAAATQGLPAEYKHLSLELKLVADIGLVGYPNAGKSTFLTKISSAQPKIANYPFTTLAPFLATLEFADFDDLPVLTIVELPGLIAGSAEGKGLGAQFLRHAERAKVLILLIDMAAEEERDPFTDFQVLNKELKTYNRGLREKPQVLVANKMDLPQAEINLRNFSAKTKQKVHPISALNGTGIKDLFAELRSYFSQEII